MSRNYMHLCFSVMVLLRIAVYKVGLSCTVAQYAFEFII